MIGADFCNNFAAEYALQSFRPKMQQPGRQAETDWNMVSLTITKGLTPSLGLWSFCEIARSFA